MKIKLFPIISIVYFLLVFILLKKVSIFPIIFLIVVLLIDYLTDLRAGIKNLLYFLAALSAFYPLLVLFLLYLPFVVFGLLLEKRGFTKSYILGFVVSFIPAIFLYLLSTYLNLPLSLPIVVFVYYLLPIIAFILLKRKYLESLEIDNKELIFLLIILFSTTLVAIGIVDNQSLFMSNGVREYARMQYAVDGLINDGAIPIYNPGIGQGEATFLWDAPSRASQFIFSYFILKFIPKILFFNAYSFFILWLSVMSLGLIFYSIANKESSLSTTLAVSAVTIVVGLNFHFLQTLESVKQFTAYPLAYLLISLIVDNPKSFKEFLILMYITAIIMTVHSAYGFGVVILAGSIFILRKAYYFKNGEELKQFKAWAIKNKLMIVFAIGVMALLPAFYFSGGFIYKDFLRNQESFLSTISPNTIKNDFINFNRNFFLGDTKILSLRYPDVNRIDDQVLGLFLSVFGLISFFVLIVLYKVKKIGNFRVFAGGYILYLIAMSLASERLSITFGGLFRTNKPYLVIVLGASILAFILLFDKKIIRLALTAAVFVAYIHAAPYAIQNISNIHKEMFMSGNVYNNELGFIGQLPIDGRIITYGLFANAMDFGSNQLTGRYFSRDEREELAYFDKSLYVNKVHEANSFGDPNLLEPKSGTELSNYLRLGGYKYTFINICHPSGKLVISKIYPDFSYPIYQNNCMVFLVMNNTNYAEKVDLVEEVNDETYKGSDGYKYVTLNKEHDYNIPGIDFQKAPKEPKPLEFEMISTIEVDIIGEFEDGDFVLFKERYWPRWKAFINGKEVQVFADNHEQILVKAARGSRITLKYSVPPIEKVFGILSMIGFIGLCILLMVLLEKAI